MEKHTDILVEQTKTKLQETFFVKLKRQMGTLSFNPVIDRPEERKKLLAVTNFDARNSVFKITDGSEIFLNTTPSR